jgi:hypothetical protein
MQILTPDEARKQLEGKPSVRAFFGSMNAADLRARKLAQGRQDKAGYLELYMGSFMDFTAKQRKHLAQWTQAADALCRPHARLMRIPWKFAMLPPDIEEGLPHTLDAVIVLSDLFFMQAVDRCVETLIHEKLHVYQRLYPLYAYKLFHDVWKYAIFDVQRKYEDARSNPDLNGIVYSKNKVGFYMRYRGGIPDGLTDAAIAGVRGTTAERYEHPNERMAYEISNLLVRPGNRADAAEVLPTLAWMRTYL